MKPTKDGKLGASRTKALFFFGDYLKSRRKQWYFGLKMGKFGEGKFREPKKYGV